MVVSAPRTLSEWRTTVFAREENGGDGSPTYAAHAAHARRHIARACCTCACAEAGARHRQCRKRWSGSGPCSVRRRWRGAATPRAPARQSPSRRPPSRRRSRPAAWAASRRPPFEQISSAPDTWTDAVRAGRPATRGTHGQPRGGLVLGSGPAARPATSLVEIFVNRYPLSQTAPRSARPARPLSAAGLVPCTPA